jgi:hypothetical protein
MDMLNDSELKEKRDCSLSVEEKLNDLLSLLESYLRLSVWLDEQGDGCAEFYKKRFAVV